MFFPIFHLHCTLLLCLKIFYMPSFTTSTVVIAPPSFSQHGIWLNLKVNIFQMKIFLSQISNKFSMWNWHPKFYLKQEETVLEFPKRVDIGMWLYPKKKVNEWMNEWVNLFWFICRHVVIFIRASMLKTGKKKICLCQMWILLLFFSPCKLPVGKA